ncbi:MAG: hypothetical protein EWV82_03635 [Microcystis aeruginosa Ma_AC_P_19900807_S299]|uniref:Tc1-like transposase DDE domain-containing protein n=1 Tax=Microcystis aeruginosa Ma_SC_T_19800800_S464 TaxID=2486257 RepID=A0A552E327_MICAE|nr:MAG: hypothetical protein EWV82_03635 [Microcystis aeruginosa Ma_AC_P_19900807_S299]TRU28906.1 MAG: hypothetical protein EWV81_03870 [Microcystis aeruginosa Ma_SC_T_19800800_S464]
MRCTVGIHTLIQQRLPPYSPDFAPMENFWSKIKSILRKLKPRTYRELEEA